VQTLTGSSVFPGWWAVVPTLSAVCIIMAGESSLFNKHVLSSAPFVFIGKISYPLYLWHWPLFVFSRVLFPKGSESIFESIALMIILSFLFALGTYFFVENPIRYRK
jgi:peptidoglycan/LPS O-acetylase OafA/YrhL